ncbi:MAG: hypothetical protein KKB51_25170, partial [Candidatus Riflebacteria bacterium]|nr:hypothetical protein [Candidatus Riflebacteria bacterium]
DIARTCGSPPGLSETWAKVKAAKLPERWPGQQDVGRVPIENLAAVLFGSSFFFQACWLVFR